MAPEYERDDITLLPLVPEAVLRRYHVHEPYDTRFRACARLLQAIWRIDRDLPIGTYKAASGRTRKLGSRISNAAGATGGNFLSSAIAQLARRELSYREPGALIDEDRVRTNLLSSMPLTFNLIGILRLDLDLAARVLQALFPDHGIARVVAIGFEHSPGRGHAALTADHSAFDAIVVFETAAKKTGFVAIEVKYSESLWEQVPPFKERYDELMPGSGLFIDAGDERLRKAPVQQLTREHCLAQAMLMRGDYDTGVFALVAPALNEQAQSAATAYASMLAPAKKQVPFVNITLERFIEAIEQAGEGDYAAQLRRRYTDWWSVDGAIELALQPAAEQPVALLPAPANEAAAPSAEIAA